MSGFSLLVVVAGIIAAVFAENSGTALRGAARPGSVSKDTLTTCGTYTEPSDFQEKANRGKIFNMLTPDEITDVRDWLLANSGLSLVAWDDAKLYTHNFITHIYLAEPDKVAALHYLETGLDKPGRYAHVHLSLPNSTIPCMREYKVGPLPTGPSTTLSAPLSFGGISDIPWEARPPETKEYNRFDVLVLEVMGQIDQEMRDSYGTNYYKHCHDEFCLTYSDTTPRGTERDITIWFLFDVEAFFANPIGFYLTFEMKGLKKNKHKLKMIVYNGQSFRDVASFKAAYAANTLIKLANRPLKNVLNNNLNGVDWASIRKAPNPTGPRTGRAANTRLNSNIVAPQTQEPGGSRFKLQDGHVEYLGWQFNIAHNPISGLKVFNVEYRGERVAYEIGLSEASAVYSGNNDFVQASTIYGDSAWGLGASANEQFLGVDCPSNGQLMDVSFLWDGGDPTETRNAICVFEHVGQFPLRRHSNGDWWGGLAATSLVVRVLLPVYNYDYVVDHVFHINGALELRAATSGYLQSTFWSPQLNTETDIYGQRIGPFTAGTTHDHVMSFKVDLDVGGIENSLIQTKTVAKKLEPADINGVKYESYKLSALKTNGNKWTTKYPVKKVIKKESAFFLNGTNTQYCVVGQGVNAWGAKRGYNIKLVGTIENVVADMKSMRAYSFTKNHVVATKRHEDEARVSSIYDQSDTTGTLMNPTNPRPLVDLDRYLENKENIDGEDLVMWLNVGVNHHTHSEDIPVTTTNGNTVQIFMLPMNLYDFDDTLDLGNSVFADAEGDIDVYDLKVGDTCAIAYSPLGVGFRGAGQP